MDVTYIPAGEWPHVTQEQIDAEFAEVRANEKRAKEQQAILSEQFALLGSHTVGSWQEANAKLKEISTRLQAGRVVHGTGYPIREPHLLAVTMDAWSGEGMGYNLTWYPEGEKHGAPRHLGSIRIGR